MKTITTLLLALCLFGQAQAIEQPSEPSSEIPLDQKQASILLNTDTYSVAEGLSQGTVTSIVEDNDGYLWIGTVNGLNRFNGSSFKHYFSDGTQTGLPSSFIRSLIINNGDLLVGTDNGLVKLDKNTSTFVKIGENLPINDLPIWSMSDSGNSIIIGTNNKVFVLNKDSSIVTSSFEDISFDGIKSAIRIDDTFIIRNYDGTIIKYKTDASIISTKSKQIIDYKGTLLSHTESGIYTLNNDIPYQVSSFRYDTIFKSKGELYGFYENKIFKINSDFSHSNIGKLQGIEYTLERPLVSSGASSLYISSINMGFIEIRDLSNIANYLSIEKHNIWSLNSQRQETLTVASDSNLISIYDVNLKLIDKYDSGITGAKSAITLKGKLFIGSAEGLYSLDLKSKIKIKISDESFAVLRATNDDDKFIAGTTNGYISTVNVSENETISLIEVDKGNPIFDIVPTTDGILVASQGGLFEIKNNSTFEIFTSDIVFSVREYNNDIYFGTTKSIFSYNVNTKEISEVYSNSKAIFSMSTRNNLLFASSINEVVLIQDGHVTILDRNTGVQDEYNTQSSIFFNGNLILGGINGLSSLEPVNIFNYIKNSSPPKVSIEEFLVFNLPRKILNGELNKPISLSKEIELNYSDYPFTFQFSSPGKLSTEIEFNYQMEGLSDTWIASQGINTATYTNLSPGEYTFNVYAIDPFVNISGDVKSIKVIITPPWWLSKQAKFIYFMLSLIISAVIVKAILRRREVQNQIAKSEERLKLSLWGSGDEMWDWDIETGQIYRSNIWGSLEFPRDGQRSGENGEESNIHPMDQERVSTALNDHFYGKSDHFEAAYRVKGKSDDWVWILDRAKIVERDEKDNPLRMTGTIKNINNFKHAEEQLRLFERAIANISEGMFILDSQFRFVEVNEACCELCLKPRDKFIGEQFNFDLYPDSYSEQIRTILNQQGRWSNDVESAKGDGSSFLMELTVDAIYDEQGQLTHYVGVFSDISRRKQQEEELRKLTNNDLLTNLPNRSSLMVTLGNLVKRDTHHTLMVLDLDNFKKINDSLGHQIGDELLIKVARRIEAAVPYHTSIYRLGGDEFAILVDDNPDIGSSAVIANSVIEAFVTPFELTSDKVVVGMSIGIVLYPEDDQNEQALLRKADIAMYHAKSAGGNRYQFYSESLNRNAIRQLEVENLIRQGIKEDLFEVYYQPKIDLKSGKMAGMEALVRLNHPVKGLIPPSEFIPLAEENGLIVEIGDIVMKKACFAAQKWRSQGIFNGRVAVNLSSYQFALPDLQQRIESILRLTQLPAANLELEITEGTVIKEPEKAIKVMQQLSKMGVSLALDDFGTGYSSLSYLKRFPIHTLKIDKAFVDDIDKSDRDLKMVDSIITIAHNMGLSVVGEGVEDASQLSILKALNCEEIQGFIFSKPVTESQFTELLHREFIEPNIVQNGKKAI